MKYIQFYSLLAVLALAGCKQESADDLQQLKDQYTSLKKQYDSIGKEMKDLERVIALKDPDVAVPNVTVLASSQKTFIHYVEVLGKIESDMNISIFPEASAKVIKLYVEEGDNVRAGQPLLKLDSKVLEQNLQELEASLAYATTIFQRQDNLWSQKIGSESQWLDAKNTKQTLEKKVAAVREQIEMYLIRAPFAGKIDQTFIKEGEMASVATPAIRLVNMSQMYVDAEIPENYAGVIRVGTEAIVKISSTGEVFDSRVTNVGGFINPANRTFRIKVAAQSRNLLPNQLVELSVQDYKKENAVVVPSNLLQQTAQGENFLFTSSAPRGVTTAGKSVVEPGLSYNHETEILSGLDASAFLLNKGFRSVREGQRIKVMEQ